MSLIGKPIEEVIETLYNSIKDKRQIINEIKTEYNINNDNYKEIKINRLKLIDLLDEFEVTISQSLQAIQTLKVEIFNIKEKQATEEILNLTTELQNKYNITENNNNNNNVFDKLEYSKTDNSIIEPNNNQKNYIDNNNIITNKNINYLNSNKFVNNNDDDDKNQIFNLKEINSLTDTKLNFDYSGLLNNSDFSLKNSSSYLDKYKIEYTPNINENKNNNNKDNKDELLLNTDIKFKRNIKIESKSISNEAKDENKIINNNNKDIKNIIELNEQEIIEDKPSKLNINITPTNNDFLNKNDFRENKLVRNDISYLSDTNNNIIKYNNKYNSSRQIESNHNKTYHFNFNHLSNMNYLNNNNSENIFTLDKEDNKKATNKEEQYENINKSNDDINYRNHININNRNDSGIEEYSIKGDNQNNFDESDIISIVSKKDILLEKIKKIEEEEKMRKLIEEVFSIKSFKLYILDKFGNGKYDIFMKRYKKGEIKKEELESELNILKDLSLKNNNSINQKNNNFIKYQKKSTNKNNNNNYSFNNGLDDNNYNSLNYTNKYYTENNSFIENSNIKYKKINDRNKSNINNRKAKDINKSETNRPFNFKNSLREENRSNNISNTSFSNQKKNIGSHSVSSIRARLKRKKF